MNHTMLYAVVERIAYEGGSIRGIFFKESEAKMLQKRLTEEQDASDVCYEIFSIEEGEEVDLSV